MSRVLIECTYVFHHPEMNSGIQRVVRNIVNRLPAVQDEAVCVPVIFKHGKILEVTQLAPSHSDAWRSRLQKKLEKVAQKLVQVRNRYWLLHSRLLPLWPWKASHNVRRATYVLCRLASFSFTLPLYLTEKMLANIDIQPRALEMTCRDDDILLLLDSSWHADFFPVAEKLQRQGVSIVSVIYDLIPLTHPQFCDGPLVQVFDRWFEWIANTADGFIAISSTIRDQVHSEVTRRLGSERASNRWFDFFHLGSELDQVDAAKTVRPAVQKLFASGLSVYLMVSTIEPRKNHAYLLDAFERLWEDGSDVVLCFVGRIGWKNERLIERVKKHPQLKRRLYMFNDLDDVELEYAYGHAKSLVFPSFVEGFGLPLVEAMQRGLPVMASDIPVFREIGGDFISYFDLDQPESLGRLIAQFESSGMFPASQKMQDWSWLGWEDSARQLVQRVLQQVNRKKHVQQKHVAGGLDETENCTE
ncbi:glycosyltransferase family 4 protein [Collimonas pratensis]|uniref:Glycosyl transferases group 1 family protein n=1 Tax=Collimonas pratensis TaxID=279113 RepID=A0ABN4MDK0_9BURK|nr:glycosyltransferase family 1 protein [Collimonas pratensis]AMP16212.1 glycosyl transferases group 1 family protein [Collimonas pratensis]